MKGKILIVDDDPDIITMLQDRLEASGYRTVTAADGQRGLELAEQESPNLLLLDLALPRELEAEGYDRYVKAGAAS